jgi:hypothetical protein
LQVNENEREERWNFSAFFSGQKKANLVIKWLANLGANRHRNLNIEPIPILNRTKKQDWLFVKKLQFLNNIIHAKLDMAEK